MLNCDWAQALTRYDCQPLTALGGGQCLEIGTPFSLPDGSAINLYITIAGGQILKISDNADILFQLCGMGLDVWQPARLASIRDLLAKNHMAVGPKGEIHALTQSAHAANGFALAITGILALSTWAAEHLQAPARTIDMVAELEPYIVARDPSAVYKRNPHVRGASNTDYVFDLQHGSDLIDIIGPSAQATGAVMRKVGDILNGPFAENLSPLIVVYDLIDSDRAMNEVSILGSVVRAMPASRLMQSLH